MKYYSLEAQMEIIHAVEPSKVHGAQNLKQNSSKRQTDSSRP